MNSHYTRSEALCALASSVFETVPALQSSKSQNAEVQLDETFYALYVARQEHQPSRASHCNDVSHYSVVVAAHGLNLSL